MKKKIIAMLILTLLVFLGIFSFTKTKQQKIECVLDLEEAFNDVNNFYLNEFELFDLSFDFPVILSNIVHKEDVLYAVSRNDANEYFVILKNISEFEKEILKQEIENQKQISNQYFTDTEIITENNYTYFAVSLDKTSIIKGIIGSNIYCENN